MKNEKYSVFPKRDALRALVKGSKKSKNGLFSDVNFFKKNFRRKFWSDQTSDSSFHE